MTTNAYENADFYDACSNPEDLRHESPEEAIEHMLDRLPGDNILEMIADRSPCKVVAWSRREVPEREVGGWAAQAAEEFTERFAEEYGSPDGDDGFTNEITQALTEGLQAIFRKTIDSVTIWACEEVAVREYSAAEVEAIMREHCPEWFEKDGTK